MIAYIDAMYHGNDEPLIYTPCIGVVDNRLNANKYCIYDGSLVSEYCEESEITAKLDELVELVSKLNVAKKEVSSEMQEYTEDKSQFKITKKLIVKYYFTNDDSANLPEDEWRTVKKIYTKYKKA